MNKAIFSQLFFLSVLFFVSATLIAQNKLPQNEATGALMKSHIVTKDNYIDYSFTSDDISDRASMRKINFEFPNGVTSFKRLFSTSDKNEFPVINTTSKRYRIEFDSCNFNFTKTMYFNEGSVPFKLQSLSISNSILGEQLYIDNFYFDWFHLLNTYVPEILIDKTSGEFNFDHVGVKDAISIYNFNGKLKSQEIQVRNDSFEFLLCGSKAALMLFRVEGAKKNKFRFYNDTLVDHFNIYIPENQYAYFYFRNCKIDCPIYLNNSNRESSCNFYNCEFGPNALIQQYSWNNLTFTNCRKFDGDLTIEKDFSLKNSDTILLTFENSDLTKFSFPYAGNFKLKPALYATSESIMSNYETLLNKYKVEGKLSSYQNLKIEYEEFQYSQNGFFGKVANFLVKTWWNYGFDRFKIFKWTALFIVIFFFGNLVARKDLNKFFPIYGGKQIQFYDRSVNPLYFRANKVLRILFISMVVFFALPINIRDLFKFKFRFIAWILFQYLVGLWCLFFILNYVIKL